MAGAVPGLPGYGREAALLLFTGVTTYFLRMKRFSLLSALLLFFCLIPLRAQDDLKPWERLGLSVTEWKLIQDNKMPMSKVEELLGVGIGISEYFTRPWERLGMTEARWIAKRRSGLTSYDIEQMALVQEKKEQRTDTLTKEEREASIAFVQDERSKENRELFASFFLPGVVQAREHQKVRAGFMIGFAAGSIAGCTVLSIANKQFTPIPLFVILVPDMIWSYIDHQCYRRSRTP
jgi:hypothetical protein